MLSELPGDVQLRRVWADTGQALDVPLVQREAVARRAASSRRFELFVRRNGMVTLRVCKSAVRGVCAPHPHDGGGLDLRPLPRVSCLQHCSSAAG